MALGPSSWRRWRLICSRQLPRHSIAKQKSSGNRNCLARSGQTRTSSTCLVGMHIIEVGLCDDSGYPCAMVSAAEWPADHGSMIYCDCAVQSWKPQVSLLTRRQLSCKSCPRQWRACSCSSSTSRSARPHARSCRSPARDSCLCQMQLAISAAMTFVCRSLGTTAVSKIAQPSLLP